MEQRYYYLKPVSFNVFLAVSCLVLVLRVTSENTVSFISIFAAILWGGSVCGIVNLVFIVMDMFIDEDYEDTNEQKEERKDPDKEKFLQVIARRFDGNKFYYGRGMISLQDEEKKELEKLYSDRWENDELGTIIPSYVSISLLNKLSDIGLVTDHRLTQQGEKIIPARQLRTPVL